MSETTHQTPDASPADADTRASPRPDPGARDTQTCPAGAETERQDLRMPDGAAGLELAALEAMEAEPLLRLLLSRCGRRAAIGTSLQETGIATIDIASRLGLSFRVFFIDTRINHPETLTLLRETEERYGLAIERFGPSEQDLRDLAARYGCHAHYFDREACCRVRKVLPLQRALASLDVWISGLRAEQSEHRRRDGRKVEWIRSEDGRPVLKVNPLFDWSDEQVRRYGAEHALPRNALYDYVSPLGERYAVIGCPCCHVPVLPHMDSRAGKFPWEHGKKECGLHVQGSGI